MRFVNDEGSPAEKSIGPPPARQRRCSLFAETRKSPRLPPDVGMDVLNAIKFPASMDANETVLEGSPALSMTRSSRTCAKFVRSAAAIGAGSEQGLPGKYDQLIATVSIRFCP
jgi:hypothetical protein